LSGTSIRGIAAGELLDRVHYFGLEPERILLLGHQLEAAAVTLHAQFGRAALISVDTAPASTGGIATGASTPSSTHLRRWWPARRLRPAVTPSHTVRARPTALPLKQQLADLSYINLLLPACVEPEQALREIGRAMRPGGLLLFASLGPDSLLELTGAAAPPGAYPDIAQLGELLMRSGFAEPVIDVERHEIRYQSAAALQTELDHLLPAAAALPAAPTGAGNDSLTLTFELIVAAAFAANSDPGSVHGSDPGSGDILVPLESIGRRKR
jgi:malonyl-CoA O-methyltransferase